MQIQQSSLLLAAMALASVAWPDSPARLVVEVPPAAASIQPLPAGRLLRLPTLEFEFAIHASCGPDQAVASVSISVADTRKTLSGAEFEDAAVVNTTIGLPARQISPIVVDDFCPDTQGENSNLLIRGAVTAQVSLRCASADGDSITYASQSLDVTLVCDANREDQGSEAVSTDR